MSTISPLVTVVSVDQSERERISTSTSRGERGGGGDGLYHPENAPSLDDLLRTTEEELQHLDDEEVQPDFGSRVRKSQQQRTRRRRPASLPEWQQRRRKQHQKKKTPPLRATTPDPRVTTYRPRFDPREFGIRPNADDAEKTTTPGGGGAKRSTDRPSFSVPSFTTTSAYNERTRPYTTERRRTQSTVASSSSSSSSRRPSPTPTTVQASTNFIPRNSTSSSFASPTTPSSGPPLRRTTRPSVRELKRPVVKSLPPRRRSGGQGYFASSGEEDLPNPPSYGPPPPKAPAPARLPGLRPDPAKHQPPFPLPLPPGLRGSQGYSDKEEEVIRSPSGTRGRSKSKKRPKPVSRPKRKREKDRGGKNRLDKKQRPRESPSQPRRQSQSKKQREQQRPNDDQAEIVTFPHGFYRLRRPGAFVQFDLSSRGQDGGGGDGEQILRGYQRNNPFRNDNRSPPPKDAAAKLAETGKRVRDFALPSEAESSDRRRQKPAKKRKRQGPKWTATPAAPTSSPSSLPFPSPPPRFSPNGGRRRDSPASGGGGLIIGGRKEGEEEEERRPPSSHPRRRNSNSNNWDRGNGDEEAYYLSSPVRRHHPDVLYPLSSYPATTTAGPPTENSLFPSYFTTPREFVFRDGGDEDDYFKGGERYSSPSFPSHSFPRHQEFRHLPTGGGEGNFGTDAFFPQDGEVFPGEIYHYGGNGNGGGGGAERGAEKTRAKVSPAKERSEFKVIDGDDDLNHHVANELDQLTSPLPEKYPPTPSAAAVDTQQQVLQTPPPPPPIAVERDPPPIWGGGAIAVPPLASNRRPGRPDAAAERKDRPSRKRHLKNKRPKKRNNRPPLPAVFSFGAGKKRKKGGGRTKRPPPASTVASTWSPEGEAHLPFAPTARPLPPPPPPSLASTFLPDIRRPPEGRPAQHRPEQEEELQVRKDISISDNVIDTVGHQHDEDGLRTELARSLKQHGLNGAALLLERAG